MPPRRHRKPPRQQHIHEQSDYDSEAFQTDHATGHTAIEEQRPHLPVRTNDELNLTVLKRHNAQIQQIVSLASFAVVYIFSRETGTWEKTGIEGTLFICELIPAVIYRADDTSVKVERFNVIVLNRKGLGNFSTELHTSASVEIADEYIILQVDEAGPDDEPAIYGLWIFSEAASSTATARELSAGVMTECARRSEESRALANATGDDDGYGEGYDGQDDEPERQAQYQHQYNGYEHGHGQQQPQSYSTHQHQHQHQQQPIPLASPQHGGQQIDLLSLFGQQPRQSPGPPGFVQAQGYNHDQNGYGQHQQMTSPQPVYLPHAHPQHMSQQQNQAQNLLSLFKR